MSEPATEHLPWDVDTTAYVRNLSREERQETHYAICHQRAPRSLGDGRTAHSMRIPALIVSAYVQDPAGVGAKVADILNRHWNEDAPPHADDVAVDRFAERMKEKLAAARAKGRSGWDDPEQCSTDHLRQLLHAHVAKGDPVDVANFCMMLDHYGASTIEEAGA